MTQAKYTHEDRADIIAASAAMILRELQGMHGDSATMAAGPSVLGACAVTCGALEILEDREAECLIAGLGIGLSLGILADRERDPSPALASFVRSMLRDSASEAPDILPIKEWVRASPDAAEIAVASVFGPDRSAGAN